MTSLSLNVYGGIHFSRNIEENANAGGIWQQWPWSRPYFKGCFSGVIVGQGDWGWWVGEKKRERSLAGHAKQQPSTQTATTPDKGGQLRSIRSYPTHTSPPTTHCLLNSKLSLYSDLRHSQLTTSVLWTYKCKFLFINAPLQFRVSKTPSKRKAFQTLDICLNWYKKS